MHTPVRKLEHTDKCKYRLKCIHTVQTVGYTHKKINTQRGSLYEVKQHVI